ncbi:MAG: hypothetical protein KDA57_18630 [Planctomycetales bacterium]|nr:hypothetical protein [Planctomycetales bacterium]
MASLFGQVRSEFSVIGELIDKRIVTSEKMKDWKLHILKVAAKGCTLEIQVSEEEYDRAATECAYQIVGSLGVEAGRTKLLGKVVQRLEQSKAAT